MVKSRTVCRFPVRCLNGQAAWIICRAGRLDRGLEPDRQGGWIISALIRTPGGGPVPGMKTRFSAPSGYVQLPEPTLPGVCSMAAG